MPMLVDSSCGCRPDTELLKRKENVLILRDIVRAGIPMPRSTVLEIGPLYRPFFLKSELDVIYVDHADTETLRNKYRVGHDFDVNEIVNVDAVWGADTLLDCTGTHVDYVIASHVIEHVPDLITWLKELGNVLRPHGQIRLVVPDKRYTFDYVRRETALQDVIDSYIRRARRPLPANIFDHVVNVRYVDTAAAWQGPLDPEKLEHRHSFEMAMNLATDALNSQSYHDVHCWVFTPHSFAALMTDLARCGLLDLECSDFGDTPYGSLEFTAFLKPSTNRGAIAESWKQVTTALESKLNSDAALLKSTDELERLHAQLHAEIGRVAQLEHELACARAALAAHENSKSWRITAPLRAIRRRLG